MVAVVLDEDSVLSDGFFDGRRELHRLHLLTEFGFEYEPKSEQIDKVKLHAEHTQDEFIARQISLFGIVHVLKPVYSVSLTLQQHYFTENY